MKILNVHKYFRINDRKAVGCCIAVKISIRKFVSAIRAKFFSSKALLNWHTTLKIGPLG